MTRNECDKHDFQQGEITKPKYPDFSRMSSVQPVPTNLNQIPDNVPAAVPEFDDSLTPGEKAQRENPTFCNYNPYRTVEFQQPGPNIPTLATPFVPNEIKPQHQPAIWNPYGKKIPRNIPPTWVNPPVLNGDLTYQTKEIPDQQTAQNVSEERKSHLPATYYNCMNPTSQKSAEQPIPIKTKEIQKSKPKMPPNNNETWWETISKWLPAKKMILPDDTNPTIIWDEKYGVWVDTSTNYPPPPDKYWNDAAITMVYDEHTEKWVDLKKDMVEGQRKMQQLMLELAAKNTAKIESDISAGSLSPAKCREKIEAVRVILSEAKKIPLLVDPASTEGAMVMEVLQSMGRIQPRIQHWINSCN